MKHAGIVPLLLATLSPATAQSLDGPVSGTLDCPAPSLFESGSTPVRGVIRNGEISVTLPGLTVSGTILNFGAQAVQLSGSSARRSAAFTGLVIGGNQLHARGVLDERPCNLNLALAGGGAPPPERQAPQRPAAAPPQRPAQPAGFTGFDGPWSGTVNCPTRSLFDSGETAARGTIVNNTLSLSFGDVRVTGRIIGMSPRPLLRLDGEGPRSGGASFDGVIVSPDRIHARGLVGQQPCNVNIAPTRTAAPQQVARPPARQQAPAGGKPAPGGSQAAIPPPASPLPAPSGDKPPPLGEVAPPPAPAPAYQPPVAAAPPPRPAAPTPRPPAVQPQRVPSPAVADQMACALAGTCPPPAR